MHRGWQEDLDNRDGQATTWDSIGYAHHHLGHHTHALALFRGVGDRYEEAATLTRLGDTHHTTGNPGNKPSPSSTT